MDFQSPISGADAIDGVSYQQSTQMQEYKYKEYMKKLNDKWATMKNEIRNSNKGKFGVKIS